MCPASVLRRRSREVLKCLRELLRVARNRGDAATAPGLSFRVAEPATGNGSRRLEGGAGHRQGVAQRFVRHGLWGKAPVSHATRSAALRRVRLSAVYE